MGSKNGYLIIIIFLFHSVVNAQVSSDFRLTDSLTYSYYNTGDWEKLIKLGKEAISKGIDYKFLRQRLGIAFYLTGNYFESRTHFEKALSFDSYNAFSLKYLYYSYLNTGKEEYAGVIEKKLSREKNDTLSFTSFKPVESVDMEYNFKYAGTSGRSNPQYFRIGVNTKLGFRFSLYQSFSNYNQTVRLNNGGINPKITDRQPDYYALLKWNVSANLLLKAAYHFIYTSSGFYTSNSNLFLFTISPDLNRLSLGATGSLLAIGNENIYQAGIQTGFVFPGRLNFYLTGTASGLFQKNSTQFIYSQKAGLKVTKRAWLEGNATSGRMANYNDFNGLYVYNSLDPMSFRAGTTLIYYLGRNITFWANFSYETKEYFENSRYHYNQFSYLGGIKWKL